MSSWCGLSSVGDLVWVHGVEFLGYSELFELMLFLDEVDPRLVSAILETSFS